MDGGSSDKRQGLMDGGSPAQRGPLLPPARLHGKGPPPFLRDLLMPRLCLRARPLLCYQLLNCSEPDPRCTINCSPPYIPAASICFRARRQSHNSLFQPSLSVSTSGLENISDCLSLALCVQIRSGGVIVFVFEKV